MYADELEVFQSRRYGFQESNIVVTDEISSILQLAANFEENYSDGSEEYFRFWITFPNRSWEEYASSHDFSDEEFDDDELRYAKELFEYDYPSEEKSYVEVIVASDRIALHETLFVLPACGIEPSNRIDPVDCQTLLAELESALISIKNDPDEYNEAIDCELPPIHRIGRIRRGEVWSLHPAWKDSFFHHAHDAALAWFLSYRPKELTPVEGTASLYFQLCKIAHVANAEELATNSIRDLPSELASVDAAELYRAFADGRDDGLLDLPPDSSAAFSAWKPCGGHPFEIFRGGNPTHISLFPRAQDGGYTFLLTSGQLIASRAIEAINAFHALVKAGYPVELAHADKLRDLIEGNDYIGIVPQDILPRYCHGMFPDEDNVNSFAHYRDFFDDGEDDELAEALCSQIEWYPLPLCKLRS